MSKIFFLAVINLTLVIISAQVYERNHLSLQRQDKYCRLQDKIYIEDDFYKWGGYNCYVYMNKLTFKYILRAKLTNGIKTQVPFGIYNNGTHNLGFFFGYKNSTEANIIEHSFLERRYFNKWASCVKNSEECCRNQMNNENIIETGDHCPALWDIWSCINVGQLGQNSTINCPDYVYMTDPPCIQPANKDCYKNGKWNQITDYTTCVFSSVIRQRHEYHVIALYVSIAVCIPAIIIFFSYPSLRITRVILHRNLLIAIVIKNILVILSKELITLDAMRKDGNKDIITTLEENGVGCRVLAFFERVAINSMYACMLVDGFYLHKIIVTVFRKDPSMILLYSVVAAFSLIPVLIWATLKAFLDNVYCWVVDDTGYQWIIDGSRYIMLGINLILLLDIIRVLVWKLKKSSGSQHTKATLRATFILLPLFGIQFIMMSQRPTGVPCFWDSMFYYVSYTIDSLQGILVSILYCYFNKDVQTLIAKTAHTIKNEINMRVFNKQPTAFNPRRSTAATYVNAPRVSQFNSQLPPVEEEEGADNNPKSRVLTWIQSNFNRK